MTTTTAEDVRTAVTRLIAVLTDAEASGTMTDDVDHALALAEELLAWADAKHGAAARFWLVPKRPHDQNAPVGPVVRRDGMIARSAGVSDPDHTRVYAAQLLAAADEAERVAR